MRGVSLLSLPNYDPFHLQHFAESDRAIVNRLRNPMQGGDAWH